MGVIFQMVELGSVGLGYTLIMGVKNISIHIQYVVMLLLASLPDIEQC